MNFKLLLISCTASFFLTGCYQVANNTDLRKAEAFCEGVENIESVTVFADGTEGVMCIDGRAASTRKIQLTPSKKSDTLQPEANN